MSLLVEYTLQEGKKAAQIEALRELVSGLKSESDGSFNYTAYETDNPTKFIAILEFDNDAGKQQFLDSKAFATYRESAMDRFTGPPSTTAIQMVATTE